MKKLLISTFLCGVIMTNLSGCGFVDGFKEGFQKGVNASAEKNKDSEANKPAKDPENDSEKQFKDPCGKFQISAPKNWSELNEIKESDKKFGIGVGNRLDETYAGTYCQSKVDFTNGMTLEKYNDFVIKSLKQQIKNAEISDVKDTDINGHKAKTFYVNGETKNMKISYIYAVVELQDSFVHIVTWTFTSRFDKNKDKLTNIINSFEEIN